MAITNKRRERIRYVLRLTMIAVAVLLVLIALVIPVVNNFVAAGVADRLEGLPLPEGTAVQDSVSMAGKLTGNGNGMQYFGALLLRSDLSLEELQAYYAPYQKDVFDDCRIKPQSGAEVEQVEHGSLSFDADVDGEGWYILYSWGSVSDWVVDILNMDMRAH